MKPARHWRDDVTMTYTPGNVLQYNEYYPFNMNTANSWTRENVTTNNFLGNGGTELNSTSALYDLEYRNYDPVLGRMNGVDPMATKYAGLTPYNFSFNDPVSFTDVNGADPTAGSLAYELSIVMSGGGSIGAWDRTQAIDYTGWGWNANPGGYGTSGYTGGYSLSGIISSYNPNYGGPVSYTNNIGQIQHAFPTTLSWAYNHQQGTPAASLTIGSGIGLPSGVWTPGTGFIASEKFLPMIRALGHLNLANYNRNEIQRLKSLSACTTCPPDPRPSTIWNIDFGVMGGFNLFNIVKAEIVLFAVEGWTNDPNDKMDGKANLSNSFSLGAKLFKQPLSVGFDVGISQKIDKSAGNYYSSGFNKTLSGNFLGINFGGTYDRSGQLKSTDLSSSWSISLGIIRITAKTPMK